MPPSGTGCSPSGTWTLGWEFDAVGCDPQPRFAETFTYRVERTDQGWQEGPSSSVQLSISGDGGLCNFDHFGQDAPILIALRPSLLASGLLSGVGIH